MTPLSYIVLALLLLFLLFPLLDLFSTVFSCCYW
jgi:hypothetical protein